jgi:hypothetical protein
VRTAQRPPQELEGVDPRAPFCRPSVVGRLVRRLELPEGARALEWGVAHGSTAGALAALGLSVTVVDPDEAALERVLVGIGAEISAIRAERPPQSSAGQFDLVLLHARDALGGDAPRIAREWLAPEGRLAFVRPVRVLGRPPPAQIEAWERLWGVVLSTPQQVLAQLAPAGYEPDFSETLGLEEMDALYASAPDALAEERTLQRAGAAAISFTLAVGRRRDADEKPRPSRDRG